MVRWYDRDEHNANLRLEQMALAIKWAEAGVEYVRRQKAGGRKYQRLKPELFQHRAARHDPYEKVLGKAVKGTLMHAWLNRVD